MSDLSTTAKQPVTVQANTAARVGAMDREHTAKPRVPLGDSKRGTAITRVLVLIMVLGLWAVAPESILPTYAFGKPWSVASEFWSITTSGRLHPALLATFEAAIKGMAVAFPLGIIIGLLCTSRAMAWILFPFITIANAIPKIAVVPLLILTLGVSTTTHIALVVITTSFVFFYSTRQAVDSVDPNRIVAMRLMGASSLKIVRSLVLPSAIPQLFAATRIALPLAFSATIFSELMVPTSQGLGILLLSYQNALNGGASIAIVLIIAGLGYLMDVVLSERQRRHSESIGAGLK